MDAVGAVEALVNAVFNSNKANEPGTTESASPPSAAATTEAPPSGQPEPIPEWTYPTRMCRICREDVVPTVTMYPPGLPPAFQRPFIEYKNEDEYGRLIKPCKCRGGMRYIHEHCLLRSRTEGVRPGSLWKCHECGYQFNFKKLTLQRYLGSKISSGALAVLFMLIIMFILGFIADPVLNSYIDPYDYLVGGEKSWKEVDINSSRENLSGWSFHFLKGLVSMGLLGFLKIALLHPFQYWNLRMAGWSSGRSTGTTTTGRDRAVNLNWIAVVIGIASAFYFFYQWTQKLIGKTLQRIGNNIVDTQLLGDDDDLKPPPGFMFKPPEPESTVCEDNGAEPAEDTLATDGALLDTTSSSCQNGSIIGDTGSATLNIEETGGRPTQRISDQKSQEISPQPDREPVLLEQQPVRPGMAFSSALDSARDQDWSFVDMQR